MLKKLVVLAFLLFFFYPSSVFAEGEFSSSYNVNYDIDDNGVANIIEGITLKNLTDKFYASSFNLLVGSSSIFDISAQDAQGVMQVNASKKGNGTQINAKFNQQVVGKNKEYNWTLKFKSKDFAFLSGKVWQVTIPKIKTEGRIDDYSVVLSVPITFGDVASIFPVPSKQLEIGSKVNFYYTKDQLLDSGIAITFGSQQVYGFNLNYKLENKNILPTVMAVSLPSTTNYQEVVIDSINPKPENVVLDKDGNMVAYFRLNRWQKVDVSASGSARLSINRTSKFNVLSKAEKDNLIKPQTYWETNNPQIKNVLTEIFNGKELNESEKIKLIYRYVVNHLNYSQERLGKQDYARLGAVTLLNNQSSALCSEFTDLFITLARASGIPARMIVGYAYTSNPELRPSSLSGTVLHAWPEYYTDETSWVMVDPTWENTTGGVDYFNKLDLNHLALVRRGEEPDLPLTAELVKAQPYDGEFLGVPKVNITINSPEEVISGIPGKITVRVENKGSVLQQPVSLYASTSRLRLTSNVLNFDLNKSFTTPQIPPFGFVEYQFTVKTANLWDSYEDILLVDGNNQNIGKLIEVKPIFKYKWFPYLIILSVALMLGTYIFVVLLHLKVIKRKK
jgi:hypothetical protein